MFFVMITVSFTAREPIIKCK